MLKYSSTLPEGGPYLERIQRQVPYAMSLALNRTAKAVQDALQQKIMQVFDRPTPYTQRALRTVRATKQSLKAYIGFKDATGKGVSANQYLWAQVHGGSRSQKRSEKALRKAGLPGGFTVPGGGAELDQYGNMSRGQIVRLLSYFEAFGEQGYRANATPASRSRLAKLTGPQFKGKKKSDYVKINGVVYFMSKGKGSVSGNRTQHLQAGIWQKSGTHGVNVKPVLLATKQAPQYSERLPFYETAEQIWGERFDAEYSTALEHALATAR